MFYFDNAATSGKKPATVISAVNYAIKELNANPGRSGHTLSVKCAEAVFRVRNKIANFFGADGAEQVVFTKNCTESINTVLKGVLKSGDHVITSDFEHNAVMRPIYKMGVAHTEIEVSLSDDEKTLNNLKNAVKENTKLVFLTSASNVCGKTLPLEKIGEFCAKKGILFAVDAAQGAGVIPINMRKMKIDYLCIAAHKGLFAVMGTGILIARKNIENTIIEGGTGTNSAEFTQPLELPEKFESGTLNVPSILSAGAGIDFVEKMQDKLYNTEMRHIQKIYEKLSIDNGFVFYTPYPKLRLFTPVISLNIEDLSSQKTAEILNRDGFAVRAGLHCAPTAHKKLGTLEIGTVRISPSIFNTDYEVNALIKSLKKIKENRKKYVE